MRRTVHTRSSTSPEPGVLDLRELYVAVVEARWAVLFAVAGALLLGVLYVVVTAPVYRSNVLVQVEEKSGTMGDLEELSSLFTGRTPSEAEMEIILSRSLLGSAVEQLRLDIVVEPEHFPVLGKGLARLNGMAALSRPPLGLSRFAWGGERLEVQRFDVPTSFRGLRFELVAEEEGRYRLLAPDGTQVLAGEVGKLAGVMFGEGAGRLELFVTQLRANPGTRFKLMAERRDEVVRQLQEELSVAERGEATGILRLSLEGKDPQRVAQTLDAIAGAYLRQNVERRSAEAQKTLEFLKQQLPEQKANLDAAETALKTHRARTGAVDLPLEAKSVLDTVVELERQLSTVEMERAELKRRFTPNHPTLASANGKVAQLRAALADANSKLRKLPEAEARSVQLTRDVKVANEVYLLLLNKAQELQVVKSGTIGNIRILDNAIVPYRPARPSKPMVFALSLLLGLAAGVGYAVVSRKGVRDPEQLETATGLGVYAVIPHSPEEAHARPALKRGRHERLPVLATSHPTALAVESLRSLRTSLQFALAESNNNIICVGGPSPDIGKSFIVVNLAHVLAQSGSRVLLVDADLRKGRLHQYLGGSRAAGLSEVIDGSHTLEGTVRKGAH
ncbi:MAG TPA: GNVR domain-containing protein, partial [Aggregicoccus sp.]|nr:GNVR domain-containing protein [Aggregicoccus sp.]